MSLSKTLKKLSKLTAKIVIVLALLYLLITLILLPIVGKIVIQKQGSKLTGQNLRLASITFNPFLLKLSLKDLKLSSESKMFVGFKEFSADLSFLSLFKKEVRVELVELSGLNINVELAKDGRIDILDIVPQTDSRPEQESKEAFDVEKLPSCFLDAFVLSDSQISFLDRSVEPSYKLDISGIAFELIDVSTIKESTAQARLEMNIGFKGGRISSEIFVKPWSNPVELDLNFKIDDYDLRSLSPYVGKFTGNMVDSGKLNLRVDTKLAQNQVKSDHNLHIQSFEFGDSVESEEALNLPFGLALAILSDSRNRIQIALPVKGDVADPEFDYWPAVFSVARNFFMKIVTKPFSILASLAGLDSSMSEELAYVKFEPGSYTLLDSEKEKILLLAKTLNDRPRLSIELAGAYDPEVDVLGIKEDIFKQEFEKMKEKSGQTDYRLLYKLYRSEYGIYKAWKAVKAYRNNQELGVNPGLTQELVRAGSFHEGELNSLAEKRARSIYELFVAEGFDTSRLSVKKPQKVQSSVGYVPLKFVLKFSQDTD